jgi:hypothetical protein
VNVAGKTRRRLVILSRALWIPGLVVAVAYFSFNVFIVFTSDYCCEVPWASIQWMPLIVTFVIAMILVVAGLALARALTHPSLAQNVLWVAAAVGWVGVLFFGIGSAGSSFYVTSAFGGGELMFYLGALGALGVIAALCVALCGVVGLVADLVVAAATDPADRQR